MPSIVRPGGLWAHVPASVDQWDQNFSSSLVQWGDLHPDTVALIRRLTEGNLSIVLSLIVFWFVANYLLTRAPARNILANFAVLAASLGLLDLFTNRVMKAQAGRLKPWFKFFDPLYPYQLSFPSSHAAACGFLAVYFCLSTRSSARPGAATYRVVTILAFAGVAVSRIVVGQHYFLDVATGLSTGALAAGLVAFLAGLARARRAAWPAPLPFQTASRTPSRLDPSGKA